MKKAPVIVFALFIVAAIAIVQFNKPSAPLTARPAVVNPQAEPDPGMPLTSIEFSDATQNMGKVEDGEKVEIIYHFKNTGQELLIIKNVAASCGCTIPEKPLEPIAPGENGIIKASFDSRGREGLNHKVIYVYANTKEAKHDLAFDVEVTPTN
ncbi:MAG: hypothetical protein RLZZ557_577 [Bacteroidota bacterium]|jgi:hypothetical protein